jgi:hypothetical protein
MVMKQLQRYEVEQKIHNFMNKKSSGKHTGELLADWFYGKATARLHKTRDYEPLAWTAHQSLHVR